MTKLNLPEQEICKQYTEGLSAEKLRKIYKCSSGTILRILRKNNIEIINKSIKCRKFNPQQEIEIVIKYLQNKQSIENISNEYRVSYETISNILKRNNVTIRTNSETSRKYSLDESYFDVIDSEDKAYFLGLLYADGNVYANSIQLKLQEQDKYILETFNKYLKSNRKLSYYEGGLMKDKNGNPKIRKTDGKPQICKSSYNLRIDSKRVSESLIKLGCVPAKSLILKFPNNEQVPEHLIRHFIRGYFDGDGSICFNSNPNVKGSGYKPNYKSALVFLGTKEFLTDLNKIFKKNNIEFKSFLKYGRVNSNSWRLQTDAILKINDFISYIYNNASEDMILFRKKVIFNNLLLYIKGKNKYGKA